MSGPVLPSGPTVTPPGLQVAPLDLINSAMRLIGVLASGESLTGPEANDALSIFNQMVDSWQKERLMVEAILRNVYPLTAGIQTYTMGPGGGTNNLDPVRYARLERAGIINLNNPAQPLELPLVMLDSIGWQAIPVKAISSALPLQLYDDRAFPQRNLNFWPFPNVPVDVALYLWTPITQFPALDGSYTFSQGLLKALRYNLAVDLAAEFPGDPERIPLIIQIARESKAIFKSANIQSPDMACDPALVPGPTGGQYNWISDTFFSKS